MPPQAQLFITCIADTLYPQIGEATVSILKRSGVQVGFPQGQTCCGQPAFNAGMHQQARQIAEHTIRVFEQSSGEIVIPSGSCAAMVRHNYPGLFVGDEVWYARAKAIADRTFELTEYLVDVLGIVDIGARYPGKLTYHSSCHLLRELGVDRQPRLLLANVREAEFVEMPDTDECCGFGGVFSVEQPEISAAMLDRKITNITTSQAPVVVACDAGCITHINGGLHRCGMQQRVVHIAEILASR